MQIGCRELNVPLPYYTIKTTQSSRMAAIAKLKVGDSVTVHVSPIVATSIAKCGLFGKGLFGC